MVVIDGKLVVDARSYKVLLAQSVCFRQADKTDGI